MTELLECRMQEYSSKEAMIYKGESYSYSDLLNIDVEIPNEKLISIASDFSPASVGILLRLFFNNKIVVPLKLGADNDKKLLISKAEGLFVVWDKEFQYFNFHKIGFDKLYRKLNGSPGLVVFSSGTTGDPKASVHNIDILMSKYDELGKSLRTISFLTFDHLGGLNTLFYILSNGGCVIVPDDRTPDSVLAAIEKYKVELLPTTPTFLNMILISRAYEKYDLSSLKIITYGTEPMYPSLLKKLNEVFPDVRFKQTYGLTELGVFNTKSKANDSLFIKIGGDGIETKIVDDILYIKSKYAMIGYLNASDPFTDDGWYNTEDKVIQDGEYIKILGRESSMINVGGQKVDPVEVENIIREMTNVSEVVVFPVSNDLLGQIPYVKIKLIEETESLKDVTKRLKDFCKDRMDKYKIPKRVLLEQNTDLHNDRFKLDRKG